MADDAGLPREFAALAGQIGELHERALVQFAPIVLHILRSRSRDAGRIERTLDHLLDFCGHAAVLQLYRRLCRHYHGIDPDAALGYVTAYRTMYGREGEPGSDGGW
ncbi:MAG: hypothetical protein K2X87_20410 [Gemmataceae bacterium]|nr:hypothetical protein [Gemmataceae bacterium]